MLERVAVTVTPALAVRSLPSVAAETNEPFVADSAPVGLWSAALASASASVKKPSVAFVIYNVCCSCWPVSPVPSAASWSRFPGAAKVIV